ncbi:hypothetical protein HL653_22945 [Sphingomonas sp. AP4-R1]|uniref:hypothetical protein n=1 Tax=Sphingomonas sp. AP4-R1 TaxID=2735134 RepID=UPI0014939475|nr:hypothetical protein [Sphingomonas sp. AP4-R1]QJU60215.1 hypothetical protein HL653_22945 [Sphingomonas sp. AP4-R1]
MKRLNAMATAALAAAMVAGSADATRWQYDWIGPVVQVNDQGATGIKVGDTTQASFIFDNSFVKLASSTSDYAT